MSWRDEEAPLIDEDEFMRGYVEGELKNYYLYLYKWHLLEREQRSLSCSTGGSIIRMSNGVSDGKSPQDRFMMKSAALEELQAPFEEKMDRIDKWISVLPEKYYDVVKLYTMRNRGEGSKKVGWEMDIGEELVRKRAERALSQICSKNSNIL